MSDHHAFVPADFQPPSTYAVGSFRLQPLGPEHNDRDYAAWTSSMEHIRSLPGYPDGRWPRDMTLEENLNDLRRHRNDFDERKGFTYTVLDAGDDVVGCLYIYPSKNDDNDAIVLSWLRKSEATHEDTFRQGIAAWLVSDAWPFDNPHYAPLLG